MDCSFDKVEVGLIGSSNRKYYVYRLVDPRTLQTFYVGKGCGDRALQHVKDARSLIGTRKGPESLTDEIEDEFSLKIKIIADIIAAGKEVIIVIHRRGLTEKEAFEVEAALIDAYSGLANIQNGHFSERGAITLEDLCQSVNTAEYEEPDEKYIIIKTTPDFINARGSLYEATRKVWRADLKRAKRYKYVLAVVYGIVREVYEAKEWYQVGDRIAFRGEPTTALASLKGKRIPAKYRAKGAAYPFLYKK